MNSRPNIEFTLTKVREYKLKPFGKFNIKFKASPRIAQRVGTLLVGEISFDYEAGMPCENVDKEIIKFMIKNKTDVLVDDSTNYYTRVGRGFTEINHKKLRLYNTFLRENGGDDTQEMWEAWQRENNEF